MSQVVSEQSAFLMTHMLADVVNHGTAYPVRQLGFKLPAAGKTGTTNDYRDAWFVGYTPRLVTGVWVGFDQPQTILGRGYAGEVAVPLWAGFMRKATQGDPPEWYKAPRRHRRSPGLPAVGQAAGGRVLQRGDRGRRRLVHHGLDGLHRVLRQGHGPDGDLPASQLSGHRQPHCVLDWRDAPVRRHADAFRKRPAHRTRLRRPRLGPAPRLLPPKKRTKEPEKKKRGFWSRLFGRGKDKDDEDKKDEEKKKDDPRPREEREQDRERER